MKTKWMYIAVMIALALNLSACGNSKEDMNSSENGSTIGTLQSEKESSAENIGNESSDDNTDSLQDSNTEENTIDEDSNVQLPTEAGSVNSSAFSGKVSGCYYADGNKIIVAADKLYLYDTQKGECMAGVDISLDDLYVQTYSDGYLVVGQGRSDSSSDSLMTSQSSHGPSIIGYLLDKDLNIKDTVSFEGLLSNDFILGTADVAISQDGQQIAFGGLRGLYLYDTSTKKVSTILNYSENSTANNMRIIMIDGLAFTGDKTLVYVGSGTNSSNGGDGFSVYGTVSTDNAGLSITGKTNYEIEEMQKGGELLIMPQIFTKNNGTLLIYDTASNSERTMTFSSIKEKDGVFCSQQGNYVATATLGDNSVTINIYDTALGKVIHSEAVTDSDNTYFLRIPQILILDESNTCIVVLGRGISKVSTLITSFGFEG